MPMVCSHQPTTSTVKPEPIHSVTLPWRLMTRGTCGGGKVKEEGVNNASGGRRSCQCKQLCDHSKASQAFWLTSQAEPSGREGRYLNFFVQGGAADQRQAPSTEGVGRLRPAAEKVDGVGVQDVRGWGLQGHNRSHGPV